MRLFSLLCCLILLSSSSLIAQSGYFEDALRFSRTSPVGTARILGVGGTQWSLGGDVTSLTGNPAGLGFFQSSEASISLGLDNWCIDTEYLNQSKSFSTSKFSLPNLSFVGANPKGPLERGAFKGGLGDLVFSASQISPPSLATIPMFLVKVLSLIFT